MKKLFAMLIAILMVSALAVSVSAFGDPVYTAPYGTATIDGEIEEAWDAAPWEEIVNNRQNGVKMTVRFKVMHDDEKVYFLIEANDPQISETKTNECVWFCLHSHACEDADFCETYTKQFMQMNGKIWDDIAKESIPADIRDEMFAVVKTDSIYVLEWSFTPDAPITNETVYGLDFLVDDYDTNAGWMGGQQYWSAYDAKAMANPYNYGKLLFADANGVVETEPVETEPVETEPVETEPAETEPAETESITAEPVTTNPEEIETKLDETAPATEKADDAEASSFPIIPVVIAAVAVIAIVVAVIVIAKKKKK